MKSDRPQLVKPNLFYFLMRMGINHMNIREHTFCVPIRTKNNEIPENTLILQFPIFSFLHEHHICSTFILGLHLTVYSFSMHWLTETLFIEHLYGTGAVWPTKWSSSRQKHFKHKRLVISANILFTYNKLFIH